MKEYNENISMYIFMVGWRDINIFKSCVKTRLIFMLHLHMLWNNYFAIWSSSRHVCTVCVNQISYEWRCLGRERWAGCWDGRWGRAVSGASHCDMEPLKGLWRECNIKSRIIPQSLFSSPSSTPPRPLS